MKVLPQGWASTSLGEIRLDKLGAVNPLKSPDKKFELYSVPAFPSGRPEIVAGKTIGSSKQIVFPGTVLVCKINPRINRAWVVGDFSEHLKLASTEWIAFPPFNEVEPRYLSYFFRQDRFRDFLAANVSGVGGSLMRARLNALDTFPVSIAPRNEQVRIAEKLDELLSDLDAGIAALERARANLKRYRAAVLKAAVEGRLTEKWRAAHPDVEPGEKLLERILAERRRKWEETQLKKFAEKKQAPPKGWKEKYSEPVKPDGAALPKLPEGWCWATIDQISEVQGGIQKQPKRAPKGNSFPYLRVGNVLRGRLDLSRLERFELFEGELERLRLEPDDLLVVEGNGSKSEIGRCAIWRGEVQDCVHQNHIIRVRLFPGLAGFVLAYWNSLPGSQRVMKQAASTSGLYTLSVQKVSALAIPLPPFAEQDQVLSQVEQQLSVLERQVGEIEAHAARSARLRQAILKRAFEGKLVSQDPKDEPASELLARIRAEREKSAAGGARKRGGRRRSGGLERAGSAQSG